MCINDEEGSDSSLVPDGENLVAVSEPTAAEAGGSVRSSISIMSQTGRVKPVEEISYGFVD